MTAGLTEVRNALQAKLTQLSAVLPHSRDEIIIEREPDALDEIQSAGEREIAMRNLDRDAVMARQIERALRRIKSGSYGVCLHCDEDISAKRIAAVPWAAYCIKCQGAIERKEIEVEEDVNSFASAAGR